ncbi:complement factor I [Lampetra fluviatilis]
MKVQQSTALVLLLCPALISLTLCAKKKSPEKAVTGNATTASTPTTTQRTDVALTAAKKRDVNKNVDYQCLAEKLTLQSCDKVPCKPWQKCVKGRCLCKPAYKCPKLRQPVCSLDKRDIPSYCHLKSSECFKYVKGFSHFGQCADKEVSNIIFTEAPDGYKFVQMVVGGVPMQISDQDWSITDANVACRQMGFPLGAEKTMLLGCADSDEQSFVTHVRCKGFESSLSECHYKVGDGTKGEDHSCRAKVAVKCSASAQACAGDSFTCVNGKCIDEARLCDGYDDCGDLSDEVCCKACKNDSLWCSTGICVPRAFVCDGENDCYNREDETTCGQSDRESNAELKGVLLERAEVTKAQELICGNSTFQPHAPPPGRVRRLIGGKNAEQGQFPWQAAVLKEKFVWTCGAVYLGSHWVLTAAHCVGFGRANMRVRLGEHSRNTKEESQDSMSVESVTIHSGYNANTNQHDIALLKLRMYKQQYQYSRYVSPACLPRSPLQFERHHTCYVSGWGTARDLQSSNKHPDVLRWVDVNLIANCSNIYNQYFMDGMDCAGKHDGSADTCDGDSGGPLVCFDNGGKAYVWGLVSWGDGCGNVDRPGVYAKVAYYLDWILQHTSTDLFPHY